jgi:protein involved in polysaccharide export with SLBB domain
MIWKFRRLIALPAAYAILSVNICFPASSMPDAGDSINQLYFERLYKVFFESYRLGAGDEIAIRILHQPDYTLDKVRVSPAGRIYHPLIGNFVVAGQSIDQVEQKLTAAFREYLKDPKVSIEINEAVSSKIAVIGAVQHPGIIALNTPMTFLDAIDAAGGFTDLGRRTNVTLVRRAGSGALSTSEVNVKRILGGKAKPEENLVVRAGDTIVVNENFRRVFMDISTVTGFGTLVTFLAGR